MNEDLKVNNIPKLKLSAQEKLVCLKEINNRLKKILHVYEKSMEPDSKYNYKIYCSGLAIYISSSNLLFNGELVNLVVNMTSILSNEFDKAEIKRIVFESVNFVNHLISVYTNMQFLGPEDLKNGLKEGLKNGID